MSCDQLGSCFGSHTFSPCCHACFKMNCIPPGLWARINPTSVKLLLLCILSQQGEEQLIHKLRPRIRVLQTNRIQINVPLCFLVATAEKKVLLMSPKGDNATGWLSSLLQSGGNFKRKTLTGSFRLVGACLWEDCPILVYPLGSFPSRLASTFSATCSQPEATEPKNHR